MKKNRIIVLILLAFLLVACSNDNTGDILDDLSDKIVDTEDSNDVVKDQAYYSKNDVALYLHKFKKLPPNYLTKKEASSKGWDSQKGNLWDVTDKGVIGGDRFGNREGLLPKNENYFEADVNYQGGRRGPERLVFTKEGKIIYYTEDHYKNFEVLYE